MAPHSNQRSLENLCTDIASEWDGFCEKQVWAFQEHLTNTWGEIKNLLKVHMEALKHENDKLHEELIHAERTVVMASQMKDAADGQVLDLDQLKEAATHAGKGTSVHQQLRAISFVPYQHRDVAFIDALEAAGDPASDVIPIERSSMDTVLKQTANNHAAPPEKGEEFAFSEDASHDFLTSSYPVTSSTSKKAKFRVEGERRLSIDSADKASVGTGSAQTSRSWRGKEKEAATICRLSSHGNGYDAGNGGDLGFYRSSKSGLSLNRQVSAEKGADGSIRANVSRMLRCKEFELAIAVAIMINAFIMCWECQYQGLAVGFNLEYPGREVQAHIVWAEAESVFLGFDWFFGCLFFLELFVKLMCWRRRYFYIKVTLVEPDDPLFAIWRFPGQECLLGLQGWNLLDFSCVIAFLFDKLSAGIKAVNPQMIRLLRLFRLFRMVRLVRFLETLDHLYIMTTAISGVKHVLAWAIVLLTLMLLTCDLFLVQILQATYFAHVKVEELSEVQLEKHHEMYEYFGTCTRCMLSMFEITLGNWPPVARLLSEEASQWFTLFCLAHKLTIGFAVISVISGVILQETFKVAQTDDVIMFRQKKMANAVLQKKLKALFHELDKSGDGTLDLGEVEALGDLPEIRTWLSSLGIETNDLKTLFALIDADGDGHITLEEMISRMPRLQGNARSIDLLAIQKTLWNNSRSKNGEDPKRSMQSCFADFLLDVGGDQKDPPEKVASRLSAASVHTAASMHI